MFGQLVDTAAEDGDLNLGRTGVARAGLEILNNFRLFLFGNHALCLILSLESWVGPHAPLLFFNVYKSGIIPQTPKFSTLFCTQNEMLFIIFLTF